MLGASIYAYRNTGRHIAALEEDDDIFNELLQPLITKKLGSQFKRQQLDHDNKNDIPDKDNDNEPIPDIVPQNIFCK